MHACIIARKHTAALKLTRHRVLIRDTNIDDPRGNSTALKELQRYRWSTQGTEAVATNTQTTDYGLVSEGKVLTLDDRPYMRCDLMEYKLCGSGDRALGGDARAGAAGNLAELKAVCKDLGLKVSGKKDELVERIRAHRTEAAAQALDAASARQDAPPGPAAAQGAGEEEEETYQWGSDASGDGIWDDAELAAPVEDPDSTATPSPSVGASKSGVSLIIVRKIVRYHWTPQAQEGRQPPFRMYIWVFFADNVSWFICQ